MVGLNDEGLNLDPACELFRNGDPTYRSVTALSRLIIPAGIGILGCASIAMKNFASKRPLRSGTHQYGIAIAIGVVVGTWLQKKKDNFSAEKDLQYYHYMTLHPEDFQPPERVKYKNYLSKWLPMR